jgi:Helix-turn-helix domain
MIVLRAYKTELDLNNVQRSACAKHAGAARWAYSWGLARKIEAYQAGQKVPTAIELHRELNAALNLERWTTASSAGRYACGEGLRPGFQAVLDEAGTEPRSAPCRFV